MNNYWTEKDLKDAKKLDIIINGYSWFPMLWSGLIFSFFVLFKSFLISYFPTIQIIYSSNFFLYKAPYVLIIFPIILSRFLILAYIDCMVLWGRYQKFKPIFKSVGGGLRKPSCLFANISSYVPDNSSFVPFNLIFTILIFLVIPIFFIILPYTQY
ncbi:MAG: hypothetical protein ACD_78C00010G0008 [uncultured bacterium (gcode 4)]|uniref:Uncharacterized protein n=1 Tax=uncultured bacterium (gcode 4) TaxID=1234023 RepID=K1XZJ0_9BACT|nr:MAG: hypothetical protein ACD_78C00010G0008 [uncultured bacterium (gcode 4)]